MLKGTGFQLPQVQPGYNSPQTGYNAGQTNNQYQLRNSVVLPGMIDGGPLFSAYGNINPNQFGVASNSFVQQQQQQIQQQDVFPYSVDVTNLANYNQYAAVKRSDVGSLSTGINQNQVSNSQNRAVTSLTGYNNNNNVANNGNRAGGATSLTGYNQPTTTGRPYTAGVSTTPVYNQLYNGVNAYTYAGAGTTGVPSNINNYNYGGAGTGVGTGTGASGVTTISSINPYIYKLTKRQSFEAPMDLMTADSKQKDQLNNLPADDTNAKMNKVLNKSFLQYTNKYVFCCYLNLNCNI